MAKNASVENFIQELKMRIELLTSTEVRANLDESSYKQIIAIIKKYTQRQPSELKPKDIVLFKIDDIKTVLTIMGVANEELNKILIAFNPNVYKYQINEVTPEIASYFARIRKMIVNYITDFNDINKAQQNAQDDKVQEYQKYVSLLSQEQIAEPFSDFDGLMRLMGMLATSNEDKWQILVHVAELNIKTANLALTDINYSKRIADMMDRYLKGREEIVAVIEKYLYGTDIDVDLIPTHAAELAKTTNLNQDQVQNIIVTILASNIHNNYIACIQKGDESTGRLKELLDTVLAGHISKENAIIRMSSSILAANESLIATSKDMMDEEILKYVDKSLSEIEQEVQSKEVAIDLKILPILKTIAETLDKIRTLDEEAEDYRICIEILKGLNEAYENIISKVAKELNK